MTKRARAERRALGLGVSHVLNMRSRHWGRRVMHGDLRHRLGGRGAIVHRIKDVLSERRGPAFELLRGSHGQGG